MRRKAETHIPGRVTKIVNGVEVKEELAEITVEALTRPTLNYESSIFSWTTWAKSTNSKKVTRWMWLLAQTKSNRTRFKGHSSNMASPWGRRSFDARSDPLFKSRQIFAQFHAAKTERWDLVCRETKHEVILAVHDIAALA